MNSTNDKIMHDLYIGMTRFKPDGWLDEDGKVDRTQVELFIQQALSTNNAEWAERIREADTLINESQLVPVTHGDVDDQFRKLQTARLILKQLTAHSKENV